MKRFPYQILVLCMVSLHAVAADVREQSDLALVQRQITIIGQLTDRARTSSTDADEARYRFDYPRLAADLERVRHGIHHYLSPSRAQPADLVELSADYRAVTPDVTPSHEHD